MKRAKTNIKENAGKLMLDGAKLTFASFILGGVLRGELPQYLVIAAGLIITSIMILFGLLWTKKNIEEKE